MKLLTLPNHLTQKVEQMISILQYNNLKHYINHHDILSLIKGNQEEQKKEHKKDLNMLIQQQYKINHQSNFEYQEVSIKFDNKVNQ